jgi:hypothetical protein
MYGESVAGQRFCVAQIFSAHCCVYLCMYVYVCTLIYISLNLGGSLVSVGVGPWY